MTDRIDDPGAVDRGLRLIYLLTPLFAVLDAGFGWTFRIAGLESGSARALYYALLTALGLTLWLRPAWTRTIAILEPAVNFGVLVIGAWMTIIQAPDAAFSGRAPILLTPDRLLNFLLSGGMLIFAIQSAIQRLRPRS